MTSTDSLKLRAKDAEDVQVISAVLQDAIVPVVDMTFRAEDKNFILVVQRLCREKSDEANLERIRCAANLRGVESVQTLGIDLHHHERMLDLLMISQDGTTMTLVFAGGAQVRLNLANDWSMLVEDFGDSWPAGCNPCHDGTVEFKL
jgi:hypothetical protein